MQEMPDEFGDNGLVLSVDAKPRLKWTPQLHDQFLDAVAQLGGAERATPKSLVRAMGIPGLTLYHLKSHLQKHRLAKNRDPDSMNINMNQDCVLPESTRSVHRTPCSEEQQIQPPFNVSMLQLQLEVQRKLQEQIEVQKHLQIRIEAQGKYLQSVLKKAHETLRGYNSTSSSTELEATEAARNSGLKRSQDAVCSTESCLTSSERPESKENEDSVEIDRDLCGRKKRSSSGICVETQAASTSKRLQYRTEHGYGLQEDIDLNR